MLFHHLLLIVSLCNKGNERKKASSFALHCTRFSVTLTSSKLLRLGIKNKYICFVLHSTFRNSGFAEVTPSRHKK